MTGTRKKKDAKQNIALIGTAVSLALGFGMFKLYVEPTNVKIEENKVKIENLDQQIAQAVSIRDKLPQLRVENEKLKQDIEAFNRSFPKEESLASLIVTVANLAERYDLDMGSIKRTVTLKEGTNIKQVQLSTTVDGDYPDIHNFMKTVTQQQRYLGLDKPSMKVTGNEMTATLNINAYVMGSATTAPVPTGIPGSAANPMPTGAASTAPEGIQTVKTAQSTQENP